MRTGKLCIGIGFALGAVGWAAALAGEAPATSGLAEAGRQRKVIEVAPVERRATAVAPGAAGPGAAAARPSVSLELFQAEHRLRLKQLTDGQITKIQALIRITENDDPQKPDLFFRAGELYAENERFYFNRARALDQKVFDTQPGPGKMALEQERQSYERQQNEWLLEAVKAYIEATKFRRYGRMDEVLYRLAAMLTGAKKDEQAREFFHRLIKDYPDSRYIPDAYLAFAEHAFEQGEMAAALRLYEKVAEFPRSSVYAYAVYKQGWRHINLGDYKQALEVFVGVVRTARDRQGKSGRRDPQLDILAREAKKDIAKAYAHVGDPDRAWTFFQRTGGDYAPKMMEALARRNNGHPLDRTSGARVGRVGRPSDIRQ